jgi:hypothetical protein
MPFLFKNKESDKWISFENDSSSFNRRKITHEKCKGCNNYTEKANMPDADEKGEYMIKLSGENNCLFSNAEDELAVTECNNDDANQLYELRKLPAEYWKKTKLPDEIKISISFSDNRTANISGVDYSLWGKKLINNSHKYKKDSDQTKTKVYHVMKNIQLINESKTIKTPKMNDLLTENLEIRCNLFQIIEEYNQNNELVGKTEYKLKYTPAKNIGDNTDKNLEGILHYDNDTTIGNRDVVISYFGRRKYTKDSLKEVNRINLFKARIGRLVDETPKYGYIDTEKYSGGIIISNNRSQIPTIFRVALKDSILNKIVKYSYPKQEVGGRFVGVNLSSYINPFKKMFVNDKNEVVSLNKTDRNSSTSTIFNVVPANKTNLESFATIEGYSDEDTDEDTDEGTDTDYSIKDRVNTFQAMLKSTNYSFENIISKIDEILNIITTNNAEDDYAHIPFLKEDLQKLRICFVNAEKLYEKISELHKNMNENYLKIGLNNVYGNIGHNGVMSFRHDIADEVVRKLKNLKKEVEGAKQNMQNDFDLSLIDVDSGILFLLINVFKYFDSESENIKKHTDVFFDYIDAKTEIEYCKTKSFLQQVGLTTNLVYNYDKLLVLPTGTLKSRIQKAVQVKDKPKAFFDVDFGSIYNQLFVDATNGSRNFVSSRINKMLHKADSITSQFINSNENRGIMHYYHDLLISQKEYYRRFLEIKSNKEDITLYKSGLPNSDDPLTILNDYINNGKKFHSGNSYFFALMNYYSNGVSALNNSDKQRQSELFLSLFKNLRYYDETGVLIPTVDYSSIKSDNFYKYYENNYFINKYYEPSIIRGFMNKYANLANKIEASNGNHDGIISINDSQLKTSEEPFSNIENFDIQLTESYHTSEPNVIAHEYSTNTFNDAFTYKPTNGDGFVNLNSYLSTDYLNGGFNGGNAFCSTVDASEESENSSPNVVMTYKCGNEGEITYGGTASKDDYRYLNDFFASADEDGVDENKISQCKSSTVSVHNIVTLTYSNDGNKCNVLLSMSVANGTDTTRVLSDSVPATTYLEPFDVAGEVVTSLVTKYTPSSDGVDATNRMDYLEDTVNSVLYDDKDKYFRLFIDNGIIKLQYKLARGIQIEIGSTDNLETKGLVDPTLPLTDPDSEKIVQVYKNDKNVGEFLNKSVYIDSTGVSHNIDSSKLNTVISDSGGTDTSAYNPYNNYCFSGTKTLNTIGTDSVARIGSSENYVYLNQDKLRHVYPSYDGACVDGDSPESLEIKKNEFNSNYGACLTDPNGVNIIDNISEYQSLSRESNDFSDEKCDKKHVFSGAVEKFKTSRNEFRSKFAIMIEKFNELNESELQMLNGTQESIENLRENINEYNELHNKATKNVGRKTIIDAQTEDSRIMLKHSQYSMALMGIGAIGATMLMFNYMKK